jgi:hypothetical protein
MSYNMTKYNTKKKNDKLDIKKRGGRGRDN